MLPKYLTGRSGKVAEMKQEMMIFDRSKGPIEMCRGKLHDFCRKAFPWAAVLAYGAFLTYALYAKGTGNIELLGISLAFVLLIIIWLLRGKIRCIWDSASKAISRRSNVCVRRHFRSVTTACVCASLFVFVVVDSRGRWNQLISCLGILFFLVVCFLLSTNPSKVAWSTVWAGIAIQAVCGLLVLRWSAGSRAFQYVSDAIATFLGYSNHGARAVFGEKYTDHPFATQVGSSVIWFSAVTSLLYHVGVMQRVVYVVGWLVHKLMNTEISESFVTAANIFLGPQGSMLMVQPMLAEATPSQLHAMLASGMATIAGGIMAVFIGMGIPATHLIAASFISAPASLVISKLLLPEDKKVHRSATLKFGEREKENWLSAFCRGAGVGIPVTAGILAVLIATLAGLQFINATLAWLGKRIGIVGLTFQYLISLPLIPVTFLLGVDWVDCPLVAELIGTKTILNEFIAYTELSKLIKNRQAGISPALSIRSEAIATYALCGFSNVGTLGMMIGFMSILAPSRTGTVAQIAVRSLMTANIACLMTACVAGLLYRES